MAKLGKKQWKLKNETSVLSFSRIPISSPTFINENHFHKMEAAILVPLIIHGHPRKNKYQKNVSHEKEQMQKWFIFYASQKKWNRETHVALVYQKTVKKKPSSKLRCFDTSVLLFPIPSMLAQLFLQKKILKNNFLFIHGKVRHKRLKCKHSYFFPHFKVP